MNNIRLHAELSWSSDRIKLYGMAQGGDGGKVMIDDVIPKDYQDGLVADSFLDISYTAAQELMDSLYNCGVRPTDGAGTAGSMKATKDHLEDMRRIAFNKLNIPQ